MSQPIETDGIIRAFSEDQVVHLTGLSKGQLRYWDSTDFFKPQYAFEDRRSPYSRVYSFRDVVGLRALSLLRKQHEISLQHLRDVARKLGHLNETMWANTRLYVFGGEVYFDEPETGQTRGAVSGQYVTIPLVHIADDVTKDVRKLKDRPADTSGRIERRRHAVRNAWVVAGTRIPTGAIAEFKEAGFSHEEIIREYPSLSIADIDAALAHERAKAESA